MFALEWSYCSVTLTHFKVLYLKNINLRQRRITILSHFTRVTGGRPPFFLLRSVNLD